MASGIAWFHAVSQLIGVLVWPAVIIVLVFGFRKQLTELLHQLTELSAAGFKAKFRRSGNDVKRDLGEAYIQDAPTVKSGAGGVEEPGQSKPEALRVRYAQRAVENPLNAILEAYLALENWFDEALTSHSLENFSGYVKLDVSEMALVAMDNGLIAPTNGKTIEGLSLMRELAIQRRDEVTPDQAREFLVLTDGLIFSLTNELVKYDNTRRGGTLEG